MGHCIYKHKTNYDNPIKPNMIKAWLKLGDRSFKYKHTKQEPLEKQNYQQRMQANLRLPQHEFGNLVRPIINNIKHQASIQSNH